MLPKTKTISLTNFTLCINELKKLKANIENEKHNELKVPFTNFKKIINEWKEVKRKVLPNRVQEVKKLLKNRPLKISVFELMEYDFHENSHSNILEYLFNYTLFKQGADVLSEFIRNIEIDNKEVLVERIQKKNYTVKREHSVEKGRIDILILDKENKFVIVIENKIYASVAKHENEDGEPVLQLKKYEKYVKENFIDFQKAFILLSYKNVEEDYKPFICADYNLLYNVLKRFDLKDNILNDYAILLKSLVGGITDKKKLLRQIHDLNKSDDLYSLQQIKTLVYGS